MKIKINAEQVGGHEKDSIIDIPDIDGVPIDLFWRNRLRDSAIDECCEVVETKEEITKEMGVDN